MEKARASQELLEGSLESFLRHLCPPCQRLESSPSPCLTALSKGEGSGGKRWPSNTRTRGATSWDEHLDWLARG